MKKIIKALKLPIVFLLIFSSFIACDKDFSILESSVLGKDNANFETNNTTYPIVAYNKRLDSLQINNLSANLLGAFNDPEYGLTTASVITQVSPSTTDPDFGENPVIDSVVINIPYFSTASFDDDGNTIYTLDSVYGDISAPIKLSIYQNNYFLRDFNPAAPDESQNYYSNANSGDPSSNYALNGTNNINFDSFKGDLIYENLDFMPDDEVIITTTGSEDDNDFESTTSIPAFREKLDTSFWKTTIIDKSGSTELSSSSNFNDYFRGLYFKAEAISNDGSLTLLNLANTDAGITIYYTYGETDSRLTSQYSLSFSGNKINTFINDYSTVPFPVTPNKTSGDDKLYLKGAEGSMAVVSLFDGLVDCDGDGNVDDDALECFIKTFRAADDSGNYIKESTTNDYVLKKLINEAHLAIYEDDNIITGTYGDNFHKFDRLFAYDIKNNTTIIDYAFDVSANSSDPFSSYIIHLSQRDTIQKKFKIRLTEHLNNILLKDSTNTKIGLVLSTNVNVITNAEILQNEIYVNEDEVTEVPATSILTPRGTILHGSNDINGDRKMQLKIFSTEPNEN